MSLNADPLDKPIWWGNNIGKEQIVLPGFSPIKVIDQSLLLGAGRKYEWKNSFLPSRIYSKNKLMLESSVINIKVNGVSSSITPDKITILEKTDHHVVVYAEGIISDNLKISFKTRVEYDGVAMVECQLTPLKPVVIEKLELEFNIKNNPWMKLLVFDTDKIGQKINKVVYEPSYSGGLVSAISLVDGEKSFWLFQDNGENWKGNRNNILRIREKNRFINISQKLISEKSFLREKIILKFNFLVTPVKDSKGNVRRNRVATNNSIDDGIYHSLNLWWITPFVHQVLPYTDFDFKFDDMLNDDSKVYPGLFENKKIIKKYARVGIDRLPYFSAHVLNHFDPAYQKYKKKWEVHPVIRWNNFKYDNPFKSMRNDNFLTHRAEGYTDYLIYRFSNLIDELGFEGIYFDQGEVRPSINPLNGLWVDSRGRAKGSTDILALRNFHKRLATLFFLKKKKGLIISHNSNDMIIPAYTFVTGMVQGEEFNNSLKNYDYINTVSLDEVRSRLAGNAYGIPTIWLEVIFSESSRLKKSRRPYRMKFSEWSKSKFYKKAYEKFMALALLHDMPTWSLAELNLRNSIMKKIDWIEPETATFIGYWMYDPKVFTDQVYHSYYESKNKSKYLVIVSNLSNDSKVVRLDNLFNKLNISTEGRSCRWLSNTIFKDDTTKKYVKIEKKNFNLLALDCG